LTAPTRPPLWTVAAGLVRTLRPRQWIKNLFVAAALLFSKNLMHPRLLARATAAVALFCLLSGAVYLINDLIDVDKDRLHPTKRRRPIASGRLPVAVAWRAAMVIGAGTLGGALIFGRAFAACALGYFALNLAYSLRLKHMVFVDVISIASGFLLRVVAGALAISVDASVWLLVCTGLLASFLGFGKRAHELATSGERAGTQRAVLDHYRLDHLSWVMKAIAGATVLAYLMYTQSEHTVGFFHTRLLGVTTPFIAFGIGRFFYLVRERPCAESPTEEMLRDAPFLVNLLLWVAAVTLIIYAVNR
jgi:4-hydroxybenzoate polyprenyltransferase